MDEVNGLVSISISMERWHCLAKRLRVKRAGDCLIIDSEIDSDRGMVCREGADML